LQLLSAAIATLTSSSLECQQTNNNKYFAHVVKAKILVARRMQVTVTSNTMEEEGDEDMPSFANQVAAANVTGKGKKNKSGGFQSMGLDHSVLRGVLRAGYRVPTPIQRKVEEHFRAYGLKSHKNYT
jgi:hypothetical protein